MKMNYKEIEYDPPYTLDEIEKHYDKKTFAELSKDPVHRWRAVTGIELIHREPTSDELERIWKNWNLMTDEMKKASDSESMRLFGVDNETHYYQIKDDYIELPKDKITNDEIDFCFGISQMMM